MPTSQADKHISFRLTGGGSVMSLTLPLNPSVLQLSWPLRQSTTQTLGGIFKDIAGLGIGQLNLQGNTGWRGGGGLDGFQIAHNLFDLYREYPKRFLADDTTELLMVDDIDGYSFKITMDNYQLGRDKSTPLLFSYTIPITILQDMSDTTPYTPDLTQALASDISVYIGAATLIAGNQTTTNPTAYTVLAGDTLSSIAYAYYQDCSKYTIIAQANNITAPYVIYPGQQLIIPAG